MYICITPVLLLVIWVAYKAKVHSLQSEIRCGCWVRAGTASLLVLTCSLQCAGTAPVRVGHASSRQFIEHNLVAFRSQQALASSKKKGAGVGHQQPNSSAGTSACQQWRNVFPPVSPPPTGKGTATAKSAAVVRWPITSLSNETRSKGQVGTVR